MRSVARLPKPILVMEMLGGLLIAAALLVVNHWLPAFPSVGRKTLATVLLLSGVVLMLPAAWLVMWRTAQAMAPQLFNRTNKKR
ncbi:MAG: DUF1418 family protein [Enterobacterales bacterium endosymbiont of Blomia tropicalis]|uniref:DUF1418 family protein n=1 Tax=Mixta mediterraneensis TaxID=2758443 RepID=UPI0018750540|nr:DUF1418 family protein [Mixta mediterraneensis]MBE5250821.1 DUF1418 family protein [Mixta mediterraneensis]MDL4913344.1 DUF1418 family protein [Mixta mediterraneensis]